jgi:YaiO family outer membrane protein
MNNRMPLTLPARAAHLFAACGLLCAWAAPARADDEPVQLKMSGFIEAGGMHHNLSGGLGTWNGEFVRGVLQTGANNVWNAEVVNASEFGDRGVLLTAGLTHTINDDWFVSASAATSSGGFFLPRLRMDAAINRKWLAQRQLVTTAGLTAVDSKDGHTDRSLLLAASYYFTQPWVLEGGARVNYSNPGGVISNTGYVAATYGEDKRRVVSLRYGFGTEAYQFIGDNAVLSNFHSDVWTLTWREWLAHQRGFQVRLESYRNPTYGRTGLEFSLFQDF